MDMAKLWQLPKTILGLIFERAASFIDSLCSCWRPSTSSKRNLSARPLLMLTYPEDHYSDVYNFYSMCENKLYKLEIPNIGRCFVCGASNGWLLTVRTNAKFPDIELINPFTRDIRPLPSLDNFPAPQDIFNPERIRSLFFIQKAIWTADPDKTSDFVVMTIFGNQNRLAFCKPEDKQWTIINTPWNLFTDVIYHKGLFYAISFKGVTVTVDVDQHPPEVTEFAPTFVGCCTTQRYLVRASDDLFYVLRHWEWVDNPDPYEYLTTHFQVFKMDSNSNTKEWIEVKSLGDLSFFLGANHSMCLSVKEYPELQPNRIYFNDDNSEGYSQCFTGSHDAGVYNMEDQTIEQFHPNRPEFWYDQHWIMWDPSTCQPLD